MSGADNFFFMEKINVLTFNCSERTTLFDSRSCLTWIMVDGLIIYPLI